MVSFNFGGQLLFLCLLSLGPGVNLSILLGECQNKTGTYTPNSTYRSNLKTLFSSLSSNAATPAAFYNVAIGANTPDVVYGLFLCVGDVSTVVCRECVVKASTEIIGKCPGSKAAIIWYSGCLLRYSNQYIFSGSEYDPGSVIYLWNSNNQIILDVNHYSSDVVVLMQDLAWAVLHQSGKRFATKQVNSTAVSTLYGLQQCIPDISTDDCNMCLQRAILTLQECCLQKTGARILHPTCILRFELYPFYNIVNTPPPPLPSPPSATSSGKHGGKRIRYLNSLEPAKNGGNEL